MVNAVGIVACINVHKRPDYGRHLQSKHVAVGKLIKAGGWVCVCARVRARARLCVRVRARARVCV